MSARNTGREGPQEKEGMGREWTRMNANGEVSDSRSFAFIRGQIMM